MHTLAKPRWEPVRQERRSESKYRKTFALLRGLKLNFSSVSSMLKYLAQTYWLGIEDSRERQLFIYRGGVT
jgi:hypothetical protein